MDEAPFQRSTHVKTLRSWLGWVLSRHHTLGAKTELRVIRRQGKRSAIYSGLFGPDAMNGLLQSLSPLPGGARQRLPRGQHPRIGEANIYFSLQGINTGLAQGTDTRLRRRKTTVKDRDISVYTLFAVDVDPERPSGLSATDAEKSAALQVTEQVRAWLAEHGAASMLADSGNGYHLLVPLVPQYGEAVITAARDAHDLLRLLHDRFSTEQAKVDTAVFNPSRIFKLYGTLAVKGTPTPERPHRYATVDMSAVPEDVPLFTLLRAELERFRAPPLSSGAPTRQSPHPRRAGLGAPPEWKAWRERVLTQLELSQIYGELLTGKSSGKGWLQCCDPSSPSGDKHPSAGVADGTGEAERGAFHSFRTGETISVFDFLVSAGQASDFLGACRLVSKLTGEPLPRRAPTEPAECFQQRWKQETDSQRRAELVRSAIAEMIWLPAIEQENRLQELRTITGLSATVFRKTVSEVKQARRKRARTAQPIQRATRTGLQIVNYVTNKDAVDELFDQLLRTIHPAERMFHTQGEMVFVDPGVGPITVHEKNISGLMASMVEMRFLSIHEGTETFNRYGVLPADLARAFVTSPRIRRKLPNLKMYTRSPLFDPDWRFIGRPGYHPEHGIFYDGPEVEPLESTEHLVQALGDFHWKEDIDLVNFIGVLVTAITMPHWGRGHPFLAINGNKPGVGKSTLARTLGVIVEGEEPNTVTYSTDDAEFEKQLATRVEAGDRVIIIDNAKVKGSIESAVLERCISDTRLNFRRLGSNTAISRPVNDLLICLTMNLTNLGADLRRRALPVNLELEGSTRSTSYPRSDLVGFVLANRLSLVAEVAGLVQMWVRQGRPTFKNPARHSTSQLWAKTVDAILKVGGFDGFLSNFDASEHAFDHNYHLMVEICQEHRDRPAATASQWAEWLVDGAMEVRFLDHQGVLKSTRSMATIMGNLFADYIGVELSLNGHHYQLQRAYPDGLTRSAVYWFAGLA